MTEPQMNTLLFTLILAMLSFMIGMVIGLRSKNEKLVESDAPTELDYTEALKLVRESDVLDRTTGSDSKVNKALNLAEGLIEDMISGKLIKSD